MKSYNQGNLATSIQQNPKRKQKISQKKRVTVRYGISGAEKLTYFFSILFLVALCLLITARYAQISSYNFQMIKMQKEIKTLTEATGELRVQIDTLSRPERIQQIAEKMGLTSNDSTVRVVK
ncbi:cell division protein FtsL [Aneurinibacillus terranovensis]|uniref:cell division protein FtsL n=1 Tax=Aneurinibacillus terranovensis TaxID=278991 RepID=UPI0004063D2E|nr:cell division protein FtsL [Aneurinibacillus terranovensis]